MTMYPYRHQIAFDPYTQTTAPGAGQIYAQSDVEHTTPLTPTDEYGNPLELIANRETGYLPPFYVEGHPGVRFVSDGFVTELITTLPLVGPQGETGEQGPKGDPGGSSPADVAAALEVAGPAQIAAKSVVAQGIQTPGDPLQTAHNAASVQAVGAIAVPKPLTTEGPHTAHIQETVNRAQSIGQTTVVIPPLDAVNPSAPWVLDGAVELFPGVTIRASGATIMQTSIVDPAFYIPPYVDDVTVDVGYCYGQTRPAYTDYPAGTLRGAVSFASNAGIMSYGSRGRFTGRFGRFRYGVRLGNWSGTGTTNEGLRNGNVVDVRTPGKDVDFAIAYAGQENATIHAEGGYSATVGTDDPPHLIYGTGYSKNARVNGKATGGSGSSSAVAFLFKQADGLVSESLVAENCPGVVVVEDRRGSVNLGKVIGRGITDEAVRGSVVGTDAGTTRVASIDVHFSDAGTTLRALSANDGWTVGDINVSYKADTTVTTQSLIHVYGAPSDIGTVKITNRGAGGVQGIRYATGTGHVLRSAPVLDGVSNGVVVDGLVSVASMALDDELIRAASAPLSFSSSADVNLRRPSLYRSNRWHAWPFGATLVNVSLEDRQVRLTPWQVAAPVTVSKVAANIATAASGTTVQFGIYRDNGNGFPSQLVASTTAVSSATTGVKEGTLSAPAKLHAGQYWLAALVVGGSGVEARGLTATANAMPATAAVDAITGGTLIFNSQSSLPATIGTPATSITGAPRFAVYVP